MSKVNCVDAGHVGCPCALAAAGKCLVCGRLSGGSCNNCNWQGACIFSLYEENKREIVKSRKDVELKIFDIERYNETLTIIKAEASYGLCQRARMPGAFMFLRNPNYDSLYDMPVSVLKSEPEKCLIHFAVSPTGPKSTALAASKNRLLARGIYYNGLVNFTKKTEKAESKLFYCKGLAIMPMRNILDTVSAENAKFYIDIDKIGHDFLRDYFGDIPAKNLKIVDFNTDLFDILTIPYGNTSIYALASPYYTDIVEVAIGVRTIKPNRGNFCCGEGICGACSFDDKEGKTIHRCKAKA